MARLLPDTRAMAGLEYALLAALVAALVVGAIGLWSGQLLTVFQRVLAACPAAHAAPQLPQAAQHLNVAAR